MSPELVLVDPELRAALAPRPTILPGGRTLPLAVDELAPRPRPVRVTSRRQRRRRYALRAILILNAILLSLVLAARPASEVQPLRAAQARESPAGTSIGPAASRPQPAGPAEASSGVSSGSAKPAPAAAPRADATATRADAERHVLEFVRRSSRLRRFVDPATGLVATNVTVACTPRGAARLAARASSFSCRIWQQSRPPSTGADVVYRARSGGDFSISIVRA